MLQESWMISKKCMRKILWMDLIKTIQTLENNHQTIWTICQFTEEAWCSNFRSTVSSKVRDFFRFFTVIGMENWNQWQVKSEKVICTEASNHLAIECTILRQENYQTLINVNWWLFNNLLVSVFCYFMVSDLYLQSNVH